MKPLVPDDIRSRPQGDDLELKLLMGQIYSRGIRAFPSFRSAWLMDVADPVAWVPVATSGPNGSDTSASCPAWPWFPGRLHGNGRLLIRRRA